MSQDNLFLFLTIILLALSIVWILTDSRALRERFKVYFGLKSMVYLLAELVIIWSTFLSITYFPWPKTQLDNWMLILGLGAYFLGAAVAVWAKITMKANWCFPAEHDIKRQNKIIKAGPFGVSRNPIYLGLILLILGYSLALRSYSILFVPLIIVYFYKAILKEEKILTKYFGKEYLDYKSKVRRFI